MSATTQPVTISTVDTKDASSNTQRWPPVLVAAISALLLWFAFPPADRGYFGWIALAPLFLLVKSDAHPRSLYLGVWAGGGIFWGLAVSWVGYADLVGLAFLVSFLSITWPLFLFLARLAVRRLKLPLMIGVPIIWVSLEYARMFVLSGLPWYYLAHSQYRYLPIIQISDLAGAWGLSLIMAMVNAWFVDLYTLPLMSPTPSGPRLTRPQLRRLGFVAVTLFATVLYGSFRLAFSHFRKGPTLALIQTDFPQELKNTASAEEVLDTVGRLVGEAMHAEHPPDLIVWPESSYPPGVVRIDPKTSPEAFVRQAEQLGHGLTPAQWQKRRDETDADLRRVADMNRIPMMVGTITYDFSDLGLNKYNSAILVEPDRAIQHRYHKQSLVAFGEYIPFLKVLPILLRLTPFTDGYVPSLSAGLRPISMESRGVRYAPLICFEDTVPDLARQSASGKNPPDVLVNLTNDGWFRGSPEHQAHLAVSVFRSVECRVPLARAVNTGISALIDGDGRIRETIPRETTRVLNVSVPLDDRSSLYLAGGDWLPLGCSAVTLGLIPLAFLRGRRA